MPYILRACVNLIVLLLFVVWPSRLWAQESSVNHKEALFPRAAQQGQQPATVHVDVTPAHELNTFDPDTALGSSIDVLSRLDINKVYSPHIIQESLSAGWGPITYRNNTELRMAAWHWTENGGWSDPVHLSGYFTGSTELQSPTRYILAYALPHRGFATDGDGPVQGPNLSYWKSNPYLTSRYTGESDARHPQWVVVDLKSSTNMNAVKIAWASPYATKYQVEYWDGTNALDFDGGPKGEWKTFPSAIITNAQGGSTIVKLAGNPLSIQYVRVLMTESSNTCDEHDPLDRRNCVGYAIQHIQAGIVDAGGKFIEAPRNPADKPVTFCVSSIDPWHSSEDVYEGGKHQHSGFDIFFTSGLTNNLPAMIPVTMLYGTPMTPPHKSRISKNAAIPSAMWKWGKSPTVNTLCRKTTAHFICNGLPPSIKSIQN
jgi:hypothetical protein